MGARDIFFFYSEVGLNRNSLRLDAKDDVTSSYSLIPGSYIG